MTREELIDQYCQDWKETDKPWERWQQKLGVGEWEDILPGLPAIGSFFEYRRKPERIQGWFAGRGESGGPERFTGPYESKEKAVYAFRGAKRYIYIDTEVQDDHD